MHWRIRAGNPPAPAGEKDRGNADQSDIVRARELRKAGREFFEPPLIDGWQRQCEQRPCGPRAHCREITQVYRERTVTNRGGRRPERKMHAAGERIDRCDQLGSRRTFEQRSIVSDAETHIRAHRAALAKVPLDQRELGKGHEAQCSCGRKVRAARSSTALTNLCPSVAPKRLVRPTASLIDTRYGTSGLDVSS